MSGYRASAIAELGSGPMSAICLIQAFKVWPAPKFRRNAVTNSAKAPLPASLLEALARYDTPTICNALEVVAPSRRLGLPALRVVHPVWRQPSRSSLAPYAATSGR